MTNRERLAIVRAVSVAILPPPAETIAHTIQLAVAPVFLLAGLGQLLNLLATRLTRVVDRARWIEQRFVDLDRMRSVAELRLLDRRMKIINIALALCTASAIAICLVVGGLFVARLMGDGFGRPVAFLFILAMILLVGTLALFLLETQLAIRAIRVRNELLERE